MFRITKSCDLLVVIKAFFDLSPRFKRNCVGFLFYAKGPSDAIYDVVPCFSSAEIGGA